MSLRPDRLEVASRLDDCIPALAEFGQQRCRDPFSRGGSRCGVDEYFHPMARLASQVRRLARPDVCGRNGDKLIGYEVERVTGGNQTKTFACFSSAFERSNTLVEHVDHIADASFDVVPHPPLPAFLLEACVSLLQSHIGEARCDRSDGPNRLHPSTVPPRHLGQDQQECDYAQQKQAGALAECIEHQRDVAQQPAVVQ